MPNWCMNTLTISHEDESKVVEFYDAFNSGNTCEHYLPTPENFDGPSGSMPGWYEWRLREWGTKWDFGIGDGSAKRDGNVVECSFDTAWSPPTNFYHHLFSLGYKIKATYFEPGCAFGGIWENGQDDYYEGDVSNYPESLIKQYNIRQWFLDSDLLPGV